MHTHTLSLTHTHTHALLRWVNLEHKGLRYPTAKTGILCKKTPNMGRTRFGSFSTFFEKKRYLNICGCLDICGYAYVCGYAFRYI